MTLTRLAGVSARAGGYRLRPFIPCSFQEKRIPSIALTRIDRGGQYSMYPYKATRLDRS
jgi:hypothetical protein